MVRFLLQCLIVISVAYAGYLLASVVLNIAPKPKKLKQKSQKGNAGSAGPDLNKMLMPALRFISRFVYMEASREAVQKEMLIRAGIDLEPKEVMARSILGAAFGLMVSVWAYFMNNTFVMIVGVVLGCALFAMSNSEASERLKEKDVEVRKELPKFVSTIVVSLRSEKNIVKVIEAYIKDAKPALRSDLEILLSQMQTGNIESALRNFDMRMGAAEISSLCTSLIYIENGVDQTAALQYLESDMRQAQATLRRLELEKLPGKMRRAFVPVGIILIGMFFYTVFMQIFKNFTMFL